MSTSITATAEVFSAQEIARAAGVRVRDVRHLLDAGPIKTMEGGFVGQAEAVRAVRRLRPRVNQGARELFAPPSAAARSPGRGLLATSALHAAMLAALIVATTLGLKSEVLQQTPPKQARLVFLATKGPGGGGGGGGLRQPAPPPRAQMKGPSTLRSPVPPPRPITSRKPEPKVQRPITPPVRPAPLPRPVEPPPPVAKPEPMPQVVAPVVASAADPRDRAGVLESASDANSQGPGSGGGAGTGQGTGIGEGEGSGIGPGSGGGTGGGPYRPGSGITPPDLLREVKPEYTEDARRKSVEGDVVLEIVVRRDGSVGSVKVLQGLGAGLDQRAVDAVRQWRFSPARRYGTPVDVIVEVAVEFKLR
jgi:protein TonB